MKPGLVPFLALFAGVFMVATAEAEPSCPPGKRPSLAGCTDGSARALTRNVPESRAVAPAKRVPKPDPALAIERARP